MFYVSQNDSVHNELSGSCYFMHVDMIHVIFYYTHMLSSPFISELNNEENVQ